MNEDHERIAELEEVMSAHDDEMQILGVRIKELEEFIAFSARTFSSYPAFVKEANELLDKTL